MARLTKVKSSATQSAEAAEVGVDFRIVPVDWLEPNDYNANEIEAELFETLLNTVKEEGMQQPILVRPKPGEDPGTVVEDRFIIVDGEHRWKSAALAGLAQVAIIVMDYDETQAKLRTLSFNAVRGNNVPIKLARLVVDLQKTYSDHEIAAMTGVPSDEQQSVLKLLDVAQHRTDDGVRLKREQNKDHVQVSLLLMPEQHAAYTSAMKIAINLMGETTTVLVGREVSDYKSAMTEAMGLAGVKLRNVALAAICEAFLSMPEDVKKRAVAKIKDSITNKRGSDAASKEAQAQKTDKVISVRTMKPKAAPAKGRRVARAPGTY